MNIFGWKPNITSFAPTVADLKKECLAGVQAGESEQQIKEAVFNKLGFGCRFFCKETTMARIDEALRAARNDYISQEGAILTAVKELNLENPSWGTSDLKEKLPFLSDSSITRIHNAKTLETSSEIVTYETGIQELEELGLSQDEANLLYFECSSLPEDEKALRMIDTNPQILILLRKETNSLEEGAKVFYDDSSTRIKAAEIKIKRVEQELSEIELLPEADPSKKSKKERAQNKLLQLNNLIKIYKAQSTQTHTQKANSLNSCSIELEVLRIIEQTRDSPVERNKQLLKLKNTVAKKISLKKFMRQILASITSRYSAYEISLTTPSLEHADSKYLPTRNSFNMAKALAPISEKPATGILHPTPKQLPKKIEETAVTRISPLFTVENVSSTEWENRLAIFHEIIAIFDTLPKQMESDLENSLLHELKIDKTTYQNRQQANLRQFPNQSPLATLLEFADAAQLRTAFEKVSKNIQVDPAIADLLFSGITANSDEEKDQIIQERLYVFHEISEQSEKFSKQKLYILTRFLEKKLKLENNEAYTTLKEEHSTLSDWNPLVTFIPFTHPTTLLSLLSSPEADQFLYVHREINRASKELSSSERAQLAESLRKKLNIPKQEFDLCQAANAQNFPNWNPLLTLLELAKPGALLLALKEASSPDLEYELQKSSKPLSPSSLKETDQLRDLFFPSGISDEETAIGSQIFNKIVEISLQLSKENQKKLAQRLVKQLGINPEQYNAHQKALQDKFPDWNPLATLMEFASPKDLLKALNDATQGTIKPTTSPGGAREA